MLVRSMALPRRCIYSDYEVRTVESMLYKSYAPVFSSELRELDIGKWFVILCVAVAVAL